MSCQQSNIKRESRTVQVDVGNVSFPAYVPLEALAAALQEYPRLSLFHVSWTSSGGRHQSRSHVLYDRKHHLLSFKCDVNSEPYGEFSRWSIFSDVTDAILRRDAADHKASLRKLPYDDQVDVIFDDLTTYGCRRHDVSPSMSEHNSLLRLKTMQHFMTKKPSAMLARAVPNAPAAQTSAIQTHLSSILDRIDTLSYLRGPIASASGYELVEQVCLDKPEVQYLLAHPAEAVPLMLERLDSPTGIHCDPTRIAYFIVFQHARNTRVLPAIARYLDAVPDGENMGAPGSPFLYAVRAIRTLAPGTLPADAPSTFPASPDLRAVFRLRHQIATNIRTTSHT